MKFFVEHARKNNMTVPLLCGGAAINSNYINRIAKEDGIYEPGVFYCNTMFEGLKTMDALISNEKPKLLADWKEKLQNWKDKSSTPIDSTTLPKSNIKPTIPPTPKLIGEPIRLKLDQINMTEVWTMIDKKSLFKLSWGLRGKAGSESEEEHEQLLTEWKVRIIREKLFEPEIVYGFFKCHNNGRKLLIENISGDDVELEFPRSTKSEHLCLTDYFGKTDVVAFQSVTVGNKVAEIIEQWNTEDKYTDAYYLHGLAVEVAEALAEWTNQKIKSELNLQRGGLRYSWGFPSCPDVSQHHLVWKLLHPEKSGMTLTESGQIIPEQSTAAIVVHHPDAKYFVL
jgi:5-methyltetrahydrofolate--homocysteine methyltransferase